RRIIGGIENRAIARLDCSTGQRWLGTPVNYLLSLLPPCDRVSELINDCSFSIKVRSDSRNIRSDRKTSLRSSLRKSVALHFRTADLSLARTEADRGMPHSKANSPSTVRGAP